MRTTAALYQALASHSDLVSRLSMYRGEPAIFTSRPVPQDARRPFVICTPAGGPHADEIGGRLGMELQWDVYCIVDNSGSVLELESIAYAVRRALHRRAINIPNATIAIRPYLMGMQEAPTDETLAGVILSFRAVAMEDD